MELSIVTTLYHSAPYIAEFYARASRAAGTITKDYEIIMVNDGSPDDSLSIAVALFEKDARIKVIDLSRNFGHHKAIMTGLAHARGRLVFLLDVDLEEAPELLIEFHQALKTGEADVIYGVQETRKGRWFERLSGGFFYSVFNALSTVKVPRNVVTARLMTQRYVESLVRHRDQELFLLGLWTITGFRQTAVPVRKLSKGRTTYKWGRKVAVLVNSVTSFSNKPLVSIFYLGCAISLISAVAAIDLLVRRVFFGGLLAGWSSLIISVWLLGGLTIFCLGIIGIYVSKIFTETKPRPYTITRRYYERARRTRKGDHT